MTVYVNDTVNKDTDCETPIPKVCGGRKVHMPTASCDTIHFTGVDDAEINQGQDFDPTEGVHAYDGSGEEIPFTVEPSEIDECQVGEIELEYTATGVGKKFLPKLCGNPTLKLPYCEVERKRLKRNLVIKGIAPPSIRGIERVYLDSETLFNPMDGVSAVDGNGNTLEVSHSGTYDGVASGEIASFESIGGKSISLKVLLEPIQSGSGTPSPDNVRPISGHTEVNTFVSPTQSASDGHTYTTDIGQTVYGGTLDVVSGVLTVDKLCTDLGNLTWTAASDGRFYASIRVGSAEEPFPYNNTQVADAVCSSYPIVARNALTTTDFTLSIHTVVTLAYINVMDSRYANSTASEFKTAMSGVQLCYELANPQTIQLTPQEVQLLLGTNNVWSDGMVTVAYPADIPDGAYNYPFEGAYEITYHAEDKCGNETTEVRQVIVSRSDSV